MGKANKNNWKQGEKQLKAISYKGPIKSIEKFTYSIDDNPIVLKEKDIYNKFSDKSFEKIANLENIVDTKKLVFKYKGPTDHEDFSKYDNAFDLIDKIGNGDISFNKVRNEQEKCRLNRGKNKRIFKKNASKDSWEARKSTIRLCDARKVAIDFFDDYTLLILIWLIRPSQARRQAKQEGTGLKILTPKQMLETLPKALAQVQAGNNSKRLLNEIRGIV